MVPQKHKKSIFKVIAFGLVCAVFGFVYSLLEKALLGDLNYYPATGNPYNFLSTLVITTGGAFFLGTVFGTVEVYFLNKLLEKGSLRRKIVFKSAFYTILICLFLVTGTGLASSVALELPLLHPEVLSTISLFLGNYAFWVILLYAGMAIIIILFFFEISDNLGQQVIKNFLIGRYHKPREEVRVFMFLDMKSSTAIAEQLGHMRYFRFLKDYYKTMSDAIAESYGEVYQYVGDEIILSWNLQEGLKNNNCLNCFFDIQRAFQKSSAGHQREFGVIPRFKAGMHFGKVTTGEIGELKKEVLFTGDVLNTTSRIQNLCNQYGVDLLVSGQLLSQLHLADHLVARDIGECELRGKNARVKLFTVLNA